MIDQFLQLQSFTTVLTAIIEQAYSHKSRNCNRKTRYISIVHFTPIYNCINVIVIVRIDQSSLNTENIRL